MSSEHWRGTLVKQAPDKARAVEAFVTARLISVAIALVVFHVVAVLGGIDTVSVPGHLLCDGAQAGKQ